MWFSWQFQSKLLCISLCCGLNNLSLLQNEHVDICSFTAGIETKNPRKSIVALSGLEAGL